jgi:hypothetical protein
MTEISRRSFLIKGSAGAAALGALTVLPALEAPAGAAVHEPTKAHPSGPAATSTTDQSSSDSLVIHIPNSRSGEIHYLIGTKEIVHKDKALVARLLRDIR